MVLRDPEGGADLGSATTATVEIRDDDVPSPLRTGPVIPIAERAFQWFSSPLSGLHVARRSTGGFVAAWRDRQLIRPPYDFWSRVIFNLFDATGQAVGGGEPDSSSEGEDATPLIVPQPDGGFFLLWASLPESDEGHARWFAQRFGAGGGSPFELSAFAGLADPLPLHAAPQVGGFVAVGQRRTGRNVQLFALRYDSAGRQLGEEVQVGERPVIDQRDVPFAVASDAAGGFVVVWRRIPQPGRPDGIIARRFAPSGAPLGAEVVVSRGDLVYSPEVAVAPDGAFAVVWDTFRGSGVIAARWFDRKGAPLGGEVQVSSGSLASGPAAAFGPGGKLLVIWSSSYSFEGQLYTGPGAREGSQLVLDNGYSVQRAFAATPEGWVLAGIFFVVSPAGDDTLEIHARTLSVPGGPAGLHISE